MSGTRDFGNLRFLKNVRVLFFKNPQKNGFLKMSLFSGSKIPLLAIHKIISHIWEDRSRKVNNDEPDLRFFHGNFRPVISQAVRKPCFSTSIPRGPNLCILGPPTWARLGPTHVGPAWAHPLGPGLGPPTWAQLGPTHLDFQTPPAPDEFSNPDPVPPHRTQGSNQQRGFPRGSISSLGALGGAWIWI